jgi:DHA2 family multidrug resistance protein-like MFS transporter
MTAPALARRWQPITVIAGGLVLSGPGCVLLTADGLVPVMIGVAVLALGTGPLFALGTTMVVGSIPPERAGSAASMSETGNYFGSSLGMALLGVVGASVYRARMADVSAPPSAREMLAGALNQHLPPELAHTATPPAETVSVS